MYVDTHTHKHTKKQYPKDTNIIIIDNAQVQSKYIHKKEHKKIIEIWCTKKELLSLHFVTLRSTPAISVTQHIETERNEEVTRLETSETDATQNPEEDKTENTKGTRPTADIPLVLVRNSVLIIVVVGNFEIEGGAWGEY